MAIVASWNKYGCLKKHLDLRIAVSEANLDQWSYFGGEKWEEEKTFWNCGNPLFIMSRKGGLGDTSSAPRYLKSNIYENKLTGTERFVIGHQYAHCLDCLKFQVIKPDLYSYHISLEVRSSNLLFNFLFEDNPVFCILATSLIIIY